MEAFFREYFFLSYFADYSLCFSNHMKRSCNYKLILGSYIEAEP
jgi:hypothetical protein